ncbi:BTAD domain-containing putative transcriptional regulator [Streptomyces sp. NPDC053079]|uniref:AfsR/SARP family transcriptional regulator n=1 Tax=Streptomyces sp. NPDC053079 TaxID=3365697 RepID=UPI0037CDC25D
MEFQLLGNVVASNRRGQVALAGAKIHTVLAALVLAHGRMVSDSRLSRSLWGANPPVTMNAQIYTYISRLRGVLGDEADLTRGQAGYALQTDSPVIDVLDFERLAKTGGEALRKRRYADADRDLRAALALWRGPALGNVTEFLAGEQRPRLEEARAGALEDRIETDLALGRHRQLVPELTGLVNNHPVRERLRAQLMTALYRCDRQGDALAVYHCGRKVLSDELGVDPGAMLHKTYLAVLKGELELAAAPEAVSAGSSSARPPVPGMLPPDSHDFTGRQRELGALLDALAPGGSGRPRLLQVTGMAGAGKSALAVRAAHCARPHFPDGQLHVDLMRRDGSPKSPDDVLSLFLRALGDTELRGQGPDDLVQRYRTLTAGKRLLVVLDNAGPDLQIDKLLPTGEESAVIITGRAHLAIACGVRTVFLGPMSEDESLALLAAVAGPERIAAEPEAARDVTAHCAGLPLALRIAGTKLAARPHWSVRRLERKFAEPAARLRELAVGELSVSGSLRPSLERLTAGGRAALDVLPLLGEGPFRADEAAALLGWHEADAEEALEELADARLLELPGADGQGCPLYRCHALVRLFAASLRAVEDRLPTTEVRAVARIPARSARVLRRSIPA